MAGETLTPADDEGPIFVQIGCPSIGWRGADITIAAADTRSQAYKSAGQLYRHYPCPCGLTPHSVRVRSEAQLRAEGGEGAVLIAYADLAKLADRYADAAA